MVVEMGAAAASGGMFGKALVATWANKTVAQAVKILGEDDVEVTNQELFLFAWLSAAIIAELIELTSDFTTWSMDPIN